MYKMVNNESIISKVIAASLILIGIFLLFLSFKSGLTGNVVENGMPAPTVLLKSCDYYGLESSGNLGIRLVAEVSNVGGAGLIQVVGNIDAEREFFFSDKKIIDFDFGETKEVIFDFPVDRFVDKRCEVTASVT